MRFKTKKAIVSLLYYTKVVYLQYCKTILTNMRTNKLFTCFITACCACMQFSSCSQPDEKSITDTWVSDVNSYGDIFQFHFDGNGKGLACYMYLWHWWVYCPAPLYTPKYFKYKDHGNKIIIDYINQETPDTLDYYIEGDKLQLGNTDYFRQSSTPYSIAPQLNLTTEVDGNQFKTIANKEISYNAKPGSKVKLSAELFVPGKECIMTENKLIIMTDNKLIIGDIISNTIDITNITDNNGAFSYEYTLPENYEVCYFNLETTYQYTGQIKSDDPENKKFTIQNSFITFEKPKQ